MGEQAGQGAPPRIDGHVHVTPDGRWFTTDLDASEARLLRELDAAGLNGAVLIPVWGVADSRFVAALCRRHPGRLAGYGMPDLAAGDLAGQVRRFREELGLRGIKLHPCRQGVDPNDPLLDPILTEAARLAMPVTFCGNPGPGPVPLDRLTPHAYDRLARRHPATTLVLAHAGMHRVQDAFWVARNHARVYLDLSMALRYYRGSAVFGELLWVADRLDRKVIYGSDFPEAPLGEYLGLFLAHALPTCDRERVLGGNLLGLLPGWRPEPV